MQDSGMLIREQLWKIVASQGTGLCFSDDKCRIALIDIFRICETKAALLVEAVALETTSELLRLNGRMHHVMLLPRLVSQFRNRVRHLTEEEAEWVIHSWAMALSVIPMHKYSGGVKPTDLVVKTVAVAEDHPGHSILMRSVAFSPDSSIVVSAGWDQTVRLWDVQAQKQVLVIGEPIKVQNLAAQQRPGFPKMYHSAVFRPDGELVAIGDQEGEIRFRSVVNGKELLVFKAHQQEVWGLAYSLDGRFLASAGADGKACLWDAKNMYKPCWALPYGDCLQSVAFAPDNSLLAVACNDGMVYLIDADTGIQNGVLQGHKSSVRSVVFSPEGKWIASAGTDGTVRLWDAISKSQIRQFAVQSEDSNNWAMSVIFCANSNTIVAGFSDGNVHGWNANTGVDCFAEKISPSIVWGVAVSPDGKSLAITGKSRPAIRACERVAA